MAIRLELTYGKKIGLPQFSSHNFSVSVTAEVTELDQVSTEVARAYAVLQKSVDEQIVNPGFVPGQNNGNGGNGQSGDKGNGTWKCSPKQRDLILRIVAEHELDRNAVDDLARKRFGKGVVDLNKLQASALLDELFETYGGGRSNGARHPQFRARRAA